MLSAIAFTLCLAVGLGLFLYQVWGRFNLLRASSGKFVLDQVSERIQSVLVYALGQKKFIRPEVKIVNETTAGWIHFVVFWGFSILGIQVATMFGRAYSDHFYLFPFTPSLLLKPYMLLRDLFEAAVFVSIISLFVRWLVTQPKRLFGYPPAEERHRHHAHWEAYLILGCIGMIVTSGPVYDGGRLIAHAGNPEFAGDAMWEPVSYLAGRLMAAIGGDGFAIAAGNVAWWAHNLAILVMLNFLPLAKHFHVITSLPNVFFRKLEPIGQLSKQDLETATTFGTSHIDQFTWKQVLDMFSCTECGRCSSQCPATATGKPLAPRQLLLDLRDYMYENQSDITTKKLAALAANGNGDGAEAPEIGRNLIAPMADTSHVIADETLWSCNLCRACEESCPVMIEYVDKIVDMRRHLVQEEARFPAELTRVFKSMETQSNPWGIGAEKRFEWADKLDIPTIADKPDAEYLYYVGCGGAFDDRNKKTTQAFTRILQRGGVD
ncbi:MAG TPA: (Fe-S)-binding protein, partial [Candidatus Binatia bacterium]|nr:(Fe-S)-binding protein [Candidatus Binatia bacterium]